MKATQGKLGRVFLLHLENGDDAVKAIQDFARENGILAAQVSVMADRALAGIITPDDSDQPVLNLHGLTAGPITWTDADVIIQELLGMRFRRVKDPDSGLEVIAKMPSTKTRVMEKPSPTPEVAGPGTVPVYLFNAEFN
ncbi:MAG: hypothetical protein LIQ30_07355 [Planctomycetes bacterium]|nr:hypothetical protein [Planctomycetota bacterium]MCD7896986.1 hypothetical protein [Planctomycetaceae bacterium]